MSSPFFKFFPQEVFSTAHAQRVSSRRKFAPFRGVLDARGHEVSSIAHAQRVSPRRRFALFRGALDAGGNLLRSVVMSLSPRAQSAFNRARAACFIAPEICPIPWCAGRERTLFPFRSCVSPCQKLPPPYKRPGRGRTRSVFHRAGNLPHSVVRWTREATFSVPW